MATSVCPICKKPSAPRSSNPSFPFCSRRCKTVDLGKWLNEEYRVPVEEEESQDGSIETKHEEKA